MASTAGTASNGYFTVSVPDSSCASLKTAMAAFYNNVWTIQTCLTDPVVVGTVINAKSSSNQTSTFPMTQMTALPPTTSSVFPTDFNSDLAGAFFAGALIPIVFLYFVSKGISEVLNFLKTA